MKSSLFDMAVQEKVDILNNIYNGLLRFNVGGFTVYQLSRGLDTDQIKLESIDKSIKILELPYIKELNYEMLPIRNYSYLFDKEKDSEIVTVKLPKELPEIDLDNTSWLRMVQRVFIWDTTKFDIESIREHVGPYSNEVMLVVQSANGRKPKVFKV